MDSANASSAPPSLHRNLGRRAHGALAFLAFTVLFVWIAGVTRLDLNAPLAYESDALEAQAYFDRAYIYNDFHTRLHAPFEISQDSSARYVFNAVFQSDSNLVWLCWLIARGNDVSALNLAYLATFLLVIDVVIRSLFGIAVSSGN